MEINSFLLDVNNQVLKYAKFLKDLYPNKRRLRGDEKIMLGKNISTVLQRNLLPKCGSHVKLEIPEL